MFDLDPAALIASGAIVIFLTQQAKRWIMPDFLPLVALAFGIIIGAGVGMAAAGAYDLAGRTAATPPPAQIIVDETYIPSGDEAYMPADLPEVDESSREDR